MINKRTNLPRGNRVQRTSSAGKLWSTEAVLWFYGPRVGGIQGSIRASVMHGGRIKRNILLILEMNSSSEDVDRAPILIVGGVDD
jgi:hypothetical protein